MTIALEFKDISFKYEQPLFEKISFKVPKEEFLVLIGPNGGGKSTLLKLALGLLKPSEGEIQVLGKKVGIKNIGYVPQEVNKVNVMPATVESVIEMGQIGSEAKSLQLLEKTIELMKLEDIRDRQIRSLSLGQRQRVMIARALASDPEMIFLDEPIASIDPESRHTVLDCLKKASSGKTVIIISHDYSIIPSCATAVACINRSVHYHSGGELTKELFQKANCYCPVELIGHGLPHRVLETHHD